jgi:hypothetical protein
VFADGFDLIVILHILLRNLRVAVDVMFARTGLLDKVSIS